MLGVCILEGAQTWDPEGWSFFDKLFSAVNVSLLIIHDRSDERCRTP